MDSKKLTKKHLTSEEYNNKINSFIFSKYNLSDILYCALSIKNMSNGNLTKLSGNIFISSDFENIILANPTKSRINIWIENGSLLQVDRLYDEYKTLETKNNLYSTIQSICYETSQTDFNIPIPNEAEVEFNTFVEAKDEGIWQFDQGNYDLAIFYYDKEIELNPHFDLAYYDKGNALLKLGKYEEAIENYDKAIEINPGFSFAYFNKGFASKLKYQVS
jgi:tetratricopeptide (TPR) repeat protein